MGIPMLRLGYCASIILKRDALASVTFIVLQEKGVGALAFRLLALNMNAKALGMSNRLGQHGMIRPSNGVNGPWLGPARSTTRPRLGMAWAVSNGKI